MGSEPPLANEKPDLQQQGFAASCLVLVLSALAVFGYAAVKYQRDQAAKEAARAAADAEQAVAEPDVPASADELPSAVRHAVTNATGDHGMNRLTRATMSLVALAAAIYIGRAGMEFLEASGGFLLLLLLGWVLALLLGAVAGWLSQPGVPTILRGRLGLPQAGPRRQLMPIPVAVLVVYVALVMVIGGVVLALVPMILPQLQQVVATVSRDGGGFADLTNTLQGLADSAGADVNVRAVIAQELLPVLRSIAGNLTGLASGIVGFFTNLIIVIVVGLYLNLGGAELAAKSLAMVPARYRGDARLLMRDVPQVFVGFIKGQSLYAFISAVGVAIVLMILGAPWLLLAAVAAFVLCLIPLLGSFLGLIPPALAALAVSPQTALLVLVVLGGFQLVLTNAVMPRLFSGPLAMEPILVLLSILIGIQLAGAWGGVLGIPVAAILQVLVRRYYHPDGPPDDRRPMRADAGGGGPQDESTDWRAADTSTGDSTDTKVVTTAGDTDDGPTVP